MVNEVLNGNLPDRLRTLVPLRLAAVWKGEAVQLEMQVTPDYLSIGTDRDFVRTPLTNYAAQYLASEMGMSLPTPFLVDQIYAQAGVQMTPQPTDWYKHTSTMRLGSNYIAFNNTLEAQRAGRGGLIAGHKKDVVLTNRLDSLPGRVAIYGWQKPGGAPLQPLATVHGYDYEDYSHGIRLLGPLLKVVHSRTGRAEFWPLVKALSDVELGNILNGGQGAIHDVRAARMCTPAFLNAVGLNSGDCPSQPRLCPN